MKREYSNLFFVVCFLLVLYFFYGILAPFLKPIIWAMVLSTVCYPLYRKVKRRLRGRAALSAGIMCVLIPMVIMLPLLAMVIGIAKQALEAYTLVTAKIQSAEWDRYLTLPGDFPAQTALGSWLGRYIDISHWDLKKDALDVLQRAGSFLIANTSGLLTGVTETVFSFLLMVIVMYFLFIEGDQWVRDLRDLSPMPEHYEELLIRQFREVSSATLYGSVLTALAHGLVGGMVFAILQIPSALLLGASTAFVSLIPIIGAFTVWLPAAVYYFAIGSTGKGFALLVLGVLIVTGIDNVLKPLLIKGKTNLHPLLVFLSVLGGLKIFGFLGLVMGPLIASLFITFLRIYKIEFREELAKKLRAARD